MQQDEDVGKMNAAVPVLICTPFDIRFCVLHHVWRTNPGRLCGNAARAIELFVQHLVEKTSKHAQEKGAKMITSLHMCDIEELLTIFVRRLTFFLFQQGNSEGKQSS